MKGSADEPSTRVIEAARELVAGFEAAAARGACGGGLDWLRAALSEASGSDAPDAPAHLVYHGVLTVVLRVVFLVCAERRGLLPVEHPEYAEQFSLIGLNARLLRDAAADPEAMAHRYGAYRRLLALFRAVYQGAGRGDLDLPARGGRLFDPETYPFLEGRLPTSAADPSSIAPSEAEPPRVDDATIYRVLRHILAFAGPPSEGSALDAELLGGAYETLMGYHLTRARPGAGRLMLQPGKERRRTGSHYTPRALTDAVVRRTLEPLVASLDQPPLGPTAKQILKLKIIDPAMGSGAFLIAACRELGEYVAAAWERRGELAAVAKAHGDAALYARRLVAQRCIYGVDKNPTAVELARLSLWLVAGDRRLPFHFVDHALRQGDSLIGLDFEQISSFHWSPKGPATSPALFAALKGAVGRSAALRQQIAALAGDDDPASRSQSAELLDSSQRAIARIRMIADACVGAFFDAPKGAARENERVRRSALIEAWLAHDPGALEEAGSDEVPVNKATAGSPALRELAGLAAKARDALTPFHWWLELPELFFDVDAPRGAEDAGPSASPARLSALVGNPPYMAGPAAQREFGSAYRDWLLMSHEGSDGNSDLVAHFFRRSAAIIGAHGAIGLVATNTISQGDTRTTGLAPLLADNFMIYDANTSIPWSGSAVVTVVTVHLARGAPAKGLAPRLDGRAVLCIDSRLRAGAPRPPAARIPENARLCFKGCMINGAGFILEKKEAEALAHNPKNRQRILPYLVGEDVTAFVPPAPRRFVIDFDDLSLEDCAAWPELLALVAARVKPHRDRRVREAHRKNWWLFAERQPGLRAALRELATCYVVSRVTKHLCLARQPTDIVFSDAVNVFLFASAAPFAVLQSRIHEAWARLHSSSMKSDLRYSAAHCFETFPFPKPDPRAPIPELDAIGERLYAARAQYMVDTNQGLTKTYNALKDPALSDAPIALLRRLHEELDGAVLAAYGWSDVAVPPYAPQSDRDFFEIQSFEEAIIDRLYALSAERIR